MGNYFLNITKQEKQNILDKHKTVYDGFVTEYGQSINNQPLYVQDYANDKNGITVSNKGVVKNYTNININESNIPIDNIDGDSEYKHRLKNKPMFNDEDDNDGDWVGELMSSDAELDEGFDDYSMKFSRGGIDYSEREFPKENDYSDDLVKMDMNYYDKYDSSIDREEDEGFNDYFFNDEIYEEDKLEIENEINESLKMFKRFKKYN